MKKKPAKKITLRDLLAQAAHIQLRPEEPTGIEATLAERGAVYGSFEDEAIIDQNIKFAFRDSKNWNTLLPYMKTALEMISVKISRVLNGDPKSADQWHDIAGYSMLVEKELKNLENK